MRRLLSAVVIVAAVLTSGGGLQPAHAATTGTITLRAAPRVTSGRLVVLRGRVARDLHRVRIERRRDGRWIVVRRARITRHRYAVALRQQPGLAWYRTSYRRGGRFVHSRVRRVLVTARDACGPRPLKADGTLWSCAHDEEFNGQQLDRTLWRPQTEFASGVQDAHACYVDDPSVIEESGGALHLSVRYVDTPVSCSFAGMSGPTHYVAGMVTTYRLKSWKYGRFEARIKNTGAVVRGLHETFWLWPDDRYPSTEVWPNAGEMDVSETYSQYPGLSIPFLHYSADSGGSQPGLNTAWNCPASRGRWNTYTLTWAPHRIEIDVNGRTCLMNTSGDHAFDKPYIAAFTEALGAGENSYDGRAPIPATMSIDYFRVWK